MVAVGADMRHSHRTSTKKWDSSSSVKDIQSQNNVVETVTLTKAELKSLLDAAIGQNPSPNGYVDFYNDVAYDVKNDAGEESGYPASLDGSPVLNHHKDSSSSEMRINMTQSFPPVGSGSSNESLARSKLDEKRRQWEKEKQELVQWDPWGKPGGGAPRQRSQSLNHVPCSSSLPYSGRSALTSSQTKPNGQYRDPSKYSLRSSIGSTTISSQRIPEYLKSNLPFGPNYSHASNGDMQDVWSKDDLGNSTFKSDITSDPWFESQLNSDMARHTSYSGLLSPTQSISNAKTESFARGQGLFDTDTNRLEKVQKAREYREYIEAQMVEKQRKQQEERERKRKEEEEEERRLDEERKLIQKQFEDEQKKLKEKEELVERKRLVLLEAVKNAQESAEAEKKAKIALKRNQGRMAQENHSMASPSHSSNSRDVHIETATKLHEVNENPDNPQSHTDDFKISQDLSNFQAWIKDDNHTSTKTEDSVVVKSQQMATVYPMQSQFNSSNLDLRETQDFGIQTEPSLSPYIQNRLLTPSQWRINERLSGHGHSSGITPANVWGFNRDMSTQTDARQNLEWKNSYHTLRKKPEHSDYAFCSSSSSTCSSATLERSSNAKQTSKLVPKSENNCDTAITNILGNENKPKWGVNKPSKNFVKMTERDPNCRRRKKLQEMRKQHWQKELATQKAMTQTKRMVLASKHETNSNIETDATNPYEGYRDAKSSTYAIPKNQNIFAENLSSTYTLPQNQKIFARVPPVQVNCDINKNSALILPPLSGRWSRSSDSLPNVMFRDLSLDCRSINVPDYTCSAVKVLGNFDSRSEIHGQPVRRKWHSQENFQPTFTKGGDSGISSLMRNSRNGCSATNSSNINESNGCSSASEDADDIYAQGVVIPTPRRKWSEQDSFDLDKIALLQAVLNRKDLERAVGIHSTDFEKSPPNTVSKIRATSESSILHSIKQSTILPQATSVEKDPLVNPNMVIERPTARQDKILQQLSTLRRGLLLKQHEIESRLRKPESPMET